MKRIFVLAVVLVLALSALTGCGCTRRGAGMDTVPSTEMTILPTNIPETTAPVMPTMEHATEHATEHGTEPASETGIGETTDNIIDDITGETNGARSRIR